MTYKGVTDRYCRELELLDPVKIVNVDYLSLSDLKIILEIPIFAISINIVQICSMLLIPYSRRLVWDINSRGAAQSMWWVMQYIFEKKHKGNITFSGDKVPPDESAVVISNHRSFTDFYMLHSVAIRRNMLPHVKYFSKDSLKYIPFFGFGMWLMGMIFIKRNWTQDEGQLRKIFKTIKRYAAPIWVVNFVEGTRLTQKKLQEVNRIV
uniref:Phospholipid/glycerol acyltransferase domain-containing protein n=1 Tax=Rhizophagus irregularis (strain DAOM 181602 / DAOM 197198 / MUCL 43194) TaxID=747089 RepID=U9UGU9_RHIID